jgi:hypothetical protein
MVSEICERVHECMNEKEKFEYPYPTERLPRNGICIFFENGESGHSGDRIVLVNTHTGVDQLVPRLDDHFERENKDRSIFRKHIGRCFLKRDNDPFLEDWERDLTSMEARERYGGRVDFRKQTQIEEKVTEYLRENLSFVVIEVEDRATRLELKPKIVSTVSLCNKCGPSLNWLGNHSTIAKIRESGLWQVQGLYKQPLSHDDLDDMGC